METSLTPIIKESKVPQTVADQVTVSLTPFFAKVDEWKATIKTIVITDPSEVGKMKVARETRLALKDMRLKGTEIIKTNREIVKKRMEGDVLEDKLWLKSGQIMELEFKTLEAQLEEKEKFAEIFEANRKKQLHIVRSKEMCANGWQDLGLIDLGALDEGSYSAMLQGQKINEAKRVEEVRKAEAQLAEKQRIIALSNKRLAECRELGLVNFITDFANIPFGAITSEVYAEIKAKAIQAKQTHLSNQQKIKDAEVQAMELPELPAKGYAQPPVGSVYTPDFQAGAVATGKVVVNHPDRDFLTWYANTLNATVIAGLTTPQGKAIYEEARGYIVKVVARINAQTAKL